MVEKSCVITGTSAGIGQAVAEKLLEDGWEVVGMARRPADIGGSGYHHVTLDLADLEALEKYFETDFRQGV